MEVILGRCTSDLPVVNVIPFDISYVIELLPCIVILDLPVCFTEGHRISNVFVELLDEGPTMPRVLACS